MSNSNYFATSYYYDATDRLLDFDSDINKLTGWLYKLGYYSASDLRQMGYTIEYNSVPPRGAEVSELLANRETLMRERQRLLVLMDRQFACD